jgi:hypothetical protein
MGAARTFQCRAQNRVQVASLIVAGSKPTSEAVHNSFLAATPPSKLALSVLTLRALKERGEPEH